MIHTCFLQPYPYNVLSFPRPFMLTPFRAEDRPHIRATNITLASP